jgi:hypothetical protein
LVIDEDHGDGFPVVLGAEFFSFFSSFGSLGVNVIEGMVVFLEVVSDFLAEWAVITSDYNNFGHWIF